MNWRSGLFVLFIGLSVCMLGCDKSDINRNEPPGDSTRFHTLWYALEHPDRAITLHIVGDTSTELPIQLLLLPKLQWLDMWEGRLKEIPSFIGEIQFLEGISFLDNAIKRVAPEIGKLRNLRSLDFARNELTSLPDEICNLERLTQLTLDSNRITVLPDSIHKLINLKYLHVSGNPISKQEIERIRRALPQLKTFLHD